MKVQVKLYLVEIFSITNKYSTYGATYISC